jgi:hypothetical protein
MVRSAHLLIVLYTLDSESYGVKKATNTTVGIYTGHHKEVIVWPGLNVQSAGIRWKQIPRRSNVHPVKNSACL